MQPIEAIRPALLMATMAMAESWTIKGMGRICNSDNSACTFQFLIDNAIDAEPTDCTLHTTGPRGVGTAACGVYDVASAWDAKEYGNGATRMVITDRERLLKINAPYSDKNFDGSLPSNLVLGDWTLGTSPA